MLVELRLALISYQDDLDHNVMLLLSLAGHGGDDHTEIPIRPSYMYSTY